MEKNPYKRLIESESIKRNKTRQAIPGFYNFEPSLYNLLLKMPFCTGKLADDEDIELIKIQDLFQFYVYDFPFKVRNIFSLMEIGSYSDASTLFRSLVESFIIYKYFILTKDGTGLSNYYSRKTKKSIRDIIDKVVPGYYDSIFAELCKSTHSDPLMLAILRGNVSKNAPIKTNINNINLDWFSIITNQLEPLIIGYINLYKEVYPNNSLESNNDIKRDLDIVNSFIVQNIKYRKNKFPNQKEMIDYYNKIIEIEKQA